VGVGIAWMLGLVMDLLLGTVLGLHAVAYAIVAYLLVKFHPRFRNLPLWQQMLFVFILCALNLTMQYVLMSLLGHAPNTVAYWLPVVTSLLIWPWLWFLLRDKHFELGARGRL